MNARYCSSCGAPLHPTLRFCTQCGSAVQPPPVMPAPPPQAPAYAAEPILSIIPALQRRKGFLGMSAETLNLILTPVRLIFVPVSSQEMRTAIDTARQQAKGQGKGWLGQVAAQMGWVDVVCEQYRSMPVDAVLAQHPDSFFILNGHVSRVRFHEVQADESTSAQRQMIVESAGGKLRFDLTTVSIQDARQTLRQVLPHVVK